ncbi:MAG: hypothetical protein P1P88_17700 [Bacteroidales bacterium]|nr:hypothetical protein [Bacteroidales bacterium]
MIRKIKFWEALVLFHLTMFVVGYVMNELIYKAINDNIENRSLVNFVIYNQLLQSFFYHLKFSLVSLLIVGAAYLMNLKISFAKIYTVLLLAQLVYFIPQFLVIIDYYVFKDQFEGTDIFASYTGQFDKLFYLSDESFGAKILKKLSIIMMLYLAVTFYLLKVKEEINSKQSANLVAGVYLPAWLLVLFADTMLVYIL